MSNDELISKQAAIDAVESAMHNFISSSIALYAARDNISVLPPTQPEIIRCGECRYYRECEIFGKKITLCKRREYDSMYTEPDDFCSRGARREE